MSKWVISNGRKYGAACTNCVEAIIAPDCSIFVSEQLVINLWMCTECGERFETTAYSPSNEYQHHFAAAVEDFSSCHWRA
jgi:ribosomal protein L37AE/L43A